MKVVGFKALQKEKKKKKHTFICISNVFKNGVMIMGITMVFLLIGLFNTHFTSSLKECIENFVSSMAQIKDILSKLLIG